MAESSIENLRASIEKEHRFKTSFNGYDRSEVQNYLKTLQDNFEKVLDELQAENKRLAAENAELMEKAEAVEQAEAELRSDERRKRDAELSIQEGLVANLRAANQRLTDEGRQKQLQIADLQQQLASVREAVADGNSALEALNETLTQTLQAKVSECKELISAWGGQFRDVLDNTGSQIIEPGEK